MEWVLQYTGQAQDSYWIDIKDLSLSMVAQKKNQRNIICIHMKFEQDIGMDKYHSKRLISYHCILS